MEVQIIKKKEGRIDRTNGVVISSRLRVAAYCRVSTGDEEQLNSYESQKKYYKEKITSNSEWYFVGIYADEAISGTQDYKRNDFMRMIQDGMENKYDMIITKSISRFARNTVDTLRYVRILKEKNIAVLFEEENINTLDMSGELLLTILSSVAQQESENISTHVKLGLKMKKERGELVGFNNCLGYHYDVKTNSMIIKEDEADIVRLIFDLYLKGYGTNGIAKKLTEMKFKPTRGGEKWSENSILRIIKNEKYKGDVLQGKTFTIDPISHKRVRNYGEEDQYYIKNHHEPIIDRETFDRVQEIIKERRGARVVGRRYGNIGRKYTFSSRLRCAYCGEVLGRRSLYVNRRQTKPAWMCITSCKKGKNHCPDSKIIREEVIENVFVDAYNLLCNNIDEVKEFLEDMTKFVKESSLDTELKNLIEQREVNKTKINKLVDLYVENAITPEIYEERKAKYVERNAKISKKIEQYEAENTNDLNIKEGIKKLKEMISYGKIMEKFDSEVFDALVDYVIIGGHDENGQIDPYMVRFVCKSKFNLSAKDEVSKEKVLLNGDIRKTNFNVILDFINRQSIFLFEKDAYGKPKKNIIDKIRVRVEME